MRRLIDGNIGSSQLPTTRYIAFRWLVLVGDKRYGSSVQIGVSSLADWLSLLVNDRACCSWHNGQGGGAIDNRLNYTLHRLAA